MATVTINFLLSPEGQKAALLAGLPGTREYNMVLDSEKEGGLADFGKALLEATPDAKGNARIDMASVISQYDYYSTQSVPPTMWDHMPSLDELLADQAARKARLIDMVVARRAEIRAATTAVLTARKTRHVNFTRHARRLEDGTVDFNSYSGGVGRGEYEDADWPYYSDDEVKKSAEAVAWLAELEEGRLAAVRKAEAEAVAAMEAAEKAEAEKAAARKAAREAMGLKDGEVALTVEEGALSQVPRGMWESHARGKNWLAVIGKDPSAPGGLARRFLEKARGSYFYLLGSLKAGDPVEFGADYYSGSGRKNSKRWYGVVVRLTGTHAVLLECDDSDEAVEAAVEMAAPLVRPEVDAARKALLALTADERASLLAEFAPQEVA